MGNRGEDLAADALRHKGYEILCRNYSEKCGEIDIIAQKGETVYFVEVKARHDTAYITPADNVNARKRRHIADTAAIWLAKNGGEKLTGFIVAEVDLVNNKTTFIEDFLI